MKVIIDHLMGMKTFHLMLQNIFHTAKLLTLNFVPSRVLHSYFAPTNFHALKSLPPPIP